MIVRVVELTIFAKTSSQMFGMLQNTYVGIGNKTQCW